MWSPISFMTSVHIPFQISLSSSLFPTRTETMQERERSGTCWCVSLCGSVWPGYQSHFILLQRSGHTADGRLSQGIHTYMQTHSLKAFKRSLIVLKSLLSTMFPIFLCLAQMTDMAVQYLTSGSQYLRELDVSGCVLLTDRTPRHLERICPPLCSITMTCCRGISR